MAPRLVRDTINIAEWAKWAPPELPALDAVDRWQGPWQRDITTLPRDDARTARLRDFDVPVEAAAGGAPWQGSTYGFPYNVASDTGEQLAVWDLAKPLAWNWFTPIPPITRIPIPADVIRREGDPLGSSDMHVRIVTPTRLFEAVAFDRRPISLAALFGYPWQCGYDGAGKGVASFDLTKPFRSGGGGVVGAGVPHLPMVTRWNEIENGLIPHALFAALPNYAPERTGWAEGTDGTWTGHPCRAGDLLRLDRNIIERFPAGSPERIIAAAMAHRGVFIGDKTTGGDPRKGSLSIALAADRRFARLALDGIRLSDFEIVNQGASR